MLVDNLKNAVLRYQRDALGPATITVFEHALNCLFFPLLGGVCSLFLLLTTHCLPLPSHVLGIEFLSPRRLTQCALRSFLCAVQLFLLVTICFQGNFDAFDLDDVDAAFARFKTLKFSQHLTFSVSADSPAMQHVLGSNGTVQRGRNTSLVRVVAFPCYGVLFVIF